MLNNLKNYRIVLASNSPRRKELLAGLGIAYEVRVLKDIDESFPDGLSGEEIATYIATAKADAYRATMAPDELIITADTIVCLSHNVLGKPHSEAEAKAMLRSLSGRTHSVITGVCLTTADIRHSFATVTEVTFDTLTDEEIDHYVTQYRPMDKAGAYGVQEWIGYIGVQKLVGSYFNVMGLPVQRLYKELQKIPAR